MGQPSREVVVLQIGQCGNQIGRRFWYELVHEAARDGQVFDSAMNTFFRNVDCRHEPPADLVVGSPLGSLRARAVLIDMEEGVVAETLRDPLFGDLFDANHQVTDVSGAGNNWAHGYAEYGEQYGKTICETCRLALERCESPQAFLSLQSVGGGTGSGLGSAVLERLADAFPEICRISVPVFPSGDDDVVTSPYNAVLATRHLAESADCVFPVENDALLVACERLRRDAVGGNSTTIAKKKPMRKGFDEMNDVAAQFLAHLTAGARYGSPVSLRDMARHLVPLPRLHFVAAGISPVLSRGETRHDREEEVGPPVAVQRLFSEACSPKSRLVRLMPSTRNSTATLSCALLMRGPYTTAVDLEKTRKSFQFAWWNSTNGMLFDVCAKPPLRTTNAAVCLTNTTEIVAPFQALRSRFLSLYKRKAMLHHYTHFVETDTFDEALRSVDDIIDGYQSALPPSNVQGRTRRPPNLLVKAPPRSSEPEDDDPPSPPPPSIDEEEERALYRL